MGAMWIRAPAIDTLAGVLTWYVLFALVNDHWARLELTSGAGLDHEEEEVLRARLLFTTFNSLLMLPVLLLVDHPLGVLARPPTFCSQLGVNGGSRVNGESILGSPGKKSLVRIAGRVLFSILWLGTARNVGGASGAVLERAREIDALSSSRGMEIKLSSLPDLYMGVLIEDTAGAPSIAELETVGGSAPDARETEFDGSPDW